MFGFLNFQSQDSRSTKAFKNVIGLFFFKGINIATGFILVPLTLNYLDPTRYGIWITLSTIFTWFQLFDIGLGHGLRNRLAEAIAKKDLTNARIYVSTTYVSLILIFGIVLIVFLIANLFINWSAILNTSEDLRKELSLLSGFVFFFFCMRFITDIIGSIALAKQEPAFSQIINVTGRVISLGAIYLVTLFTESHLLYLGITLTAVPAIVSLVFSIIIFRFRYRDIRPSFRFVRFNQLKYILNLGIKFFFIQISAMIIYQTGNIIIAQLFGPDQVTPYSISFQYFSAATMVFGILLTPYWSAITDAYTKGENYWIKKIMKKLKTYWIGMVIFVVILYFFSNFLITLWVGSNVEIDRGLYLIMAIYVLVNALNSIYASFLNGVGKVMLQLYLSVALSITYVPLALIFCKRFGIKGILMPVILFSFLTVIILNKQYIKILNGTAKAIWNR